MQTPLDFFNSGGFFLPEEWFFHYIDHLIGNVMHEILEFFHDFSFKTIFVVGLIVWFFHRRAKTQENRNQERIDRLYEMFTQFQKDFDEKFFAFLKDKKD